MEHLSNSHKDHPNQQKKSTFEMLDQKWLQHTITIVAELLGLFLFSLLLVLLMKLLKGEAWSCKLHMDLSKQS